MGCIKYLITYDIIIFQVAVYFLFVEKLDSNLTEFFLYYKDLFSSEYLMLVWLSFFFKSMELWYIFLLKLVLIAELITYVKYITFGSVIKSVLWKDRWSHSGFCCWKLVKIAVIKNWSHYNELQLEWFHDKFLLPNKSRAVDKRKIFFARIWKPQPKMFLL